MRIALLSWETKHSVAVGGMAEHVSELAAALHALGHAVHVFTRSAPNLTLYQNFDGVHCHRCPYEPHPDPLVENKRMCDSFVWHLAETESFLSGRFDVVHGHDWLSVEAIKQAKDRHRRPVVMTVHSTEYGRCGNQLFGGVSEVIRHREWEGLYVAERVICVSGALKREVRDLYQVPADKMHVIYNGVDVKRFDVRVNRRNVRRDYGVGRSDPFVLFAGRLTWQKGPDLLVEAMPGLLAGFHNIKVVFAGDGNLREDLEQRSADLGVGRSARFAGHRMGSDLVGLFSAADVVCVPSRNEPFGIVILEAWSARKPVVATRNGGPAEFVRHGENGLTVADTTPEIGAAVQSVLEDRLDAERMGQNGRWEAESKFTWETIARETEMVYHSVIRT